MAQNGNWEIMKLQAFPILLF